MRSVALPLAVAAITFAIGSTRWASAEQPVHEIHVLARTFAFEPSTITVTAGEHVRLVLRSGDTVHGFAIRDLKVDVQVPRGGDAVTVDFTAPPAGRYAIACSEFCGHGHAQMRAALVSVNATPTALRPEGLISHARFSR